MRLASSNGRIVDDVDVLLLVMAEQQAKKFAAAGEHGRARLMREAADELRAARRKSAQ